MLWIFKMFKNNEINATIVDSDEGKLFNNERHVNIYDDSLHPYGELSCNGLVDYFLDISAVGKIMSEMQD